MGTLQKRANKSILCLLLVAACFFGIQPAHATALSVSAVVVGNVPPEQGVTVELHGYAAPGALMVVTRNSISVASSTTGSLGVFDFILGGQPTGQQTYIISGTDRDGHLLAPLTLVFTLRQGTTTIVDGIFLGPSIALDKTTVKSGQPVVVTGTTVPSSTVSVTVHSNEALVLSTTSDANGRWTQTINTNVLSVGTHSAMATAVTGTTRSAESEVVQFAVGAVDRCDGKKTADLNCDAHVNLTDFSILLFFWKTTSPSNIRADINGDGVVTIVDFSIMLFQWTN